MDSPLSSLAHRLYGALAAATRPTTATMAEQLAVDVEAVEGAADELVAVGLVAPSQVNEGEWRVVHPSTALGSFLSDAEDAAAQALLRVSCLRTDITSLARTFISKEIRPATTEDCTFEVLPDRDSVLRQMELTAERTTERLWAFLTQRPTLAALNSSHVADQGMLARGVKLRTLCLDGFLRDPRLVRAMRSRSADGAEIRTTPSLPARMVIMDDHAFVARDPANLKAGAVMTGSAGLVATLVDYFEHRWSRASPLPTTALKSHSMGGVAGPISETELTLLRMLADGHKDERISRTVNLSVRTIRRIIADLSSQVDAQSRFQLAILARDRGWI